MTDLRKAAEMALEALDSCEFDYDNEERQVRSFDAPLVNAASRALHQALAQPEPWDTFDMAHRSGGLSMDQEPVAWEKSYDTACALLRQAHDILAMTQYPIKRPWVSLTEEESSDIYNAHHNTYGECITSADDLVLDIEAALRSKNDPTSH